MFIAQGASPPGTAAGAKGNKNASQKKRAGRGITLTLKYD